MKKNGRSSYAGVLLVIFAGIGWGANGVLGVLAPAEALPVAKGAMRLLLSGVALELICFFLYRNSDCNSELQKSSFTGERLSGFLTATAGIVGYNMTFYSAVILTGVTVGTMIAVGLSPVIAGITGRILFGERFTKRWYITTAMAVTGCVFLAAAGNKGTALVFNPGGILLALLSGFFYSLTGTGFRIAQDSSFRNLAHSFMAGGLITAPLLFIYKATWFFTPRGFTVAVLIALAATVIPYILFYGGIKRISLGKAYTLSLSEPLTAWLLSFLLLGEELSAYGVTGVALLVTAIAVLATEK